MYTSSSSHKHDFSIEFSLAKLTLLRVFYRCARVAETLEAYSITYRLRIGNL